MQVHAGFLLLPKVYSACGQQLAATTSPMVCSHTRSPETLLVCRHAVHASSAAVVMCQGMSARFRCFCQANQGKLMRLRFGAATICLNGSQHQHAQCSVCVHHTIVATIVEPRSFLAGVCADRACMSLIDALAIRPVWLHNSCCCLQAAWLVLLGTSSFLTASSETTGPTLQAMARSQLPCHVV